MPKFSKLHLSMTSQAGLDLISVPDTFYVLRDCGSAGRRRPIPPGADEDTLLRFGIRSGGKIANRGHFSTREFSENPLSPFRPQEWFEERFYIR